MFILLGSHQNLSAILSGHLSLSQPTQPSQPSQKTQPPPTRPFPAQSKPSSFPSSPSNTSRTTFKPKVCASCTSSRNNSWRIHGCLRAHRIDFKGRNRQETVVLPCFIGKYMGKSWKISSFTITIESCRIALDSSLVAVSENILH